MPLCPRGTCFCQASLSREREPLPLSPPPQDHYDRSNEILASYLQKVPDSGIAVNLKACNTFRTFNGKAAEAELAELGDYGGQENDLVTHNKVVFRGGEGALQLLPPLQGFIPEAKLNLVIYYLRAGEVGEAYNLVKDMEPQSPPVRFFAPAQESTHSPPVLCFAPVSRSRLCAGSSRGSCCSRLSGERVLHAPVASLRRCARSFPPIDGNCRAGVYS